MNAILGTEHASRFVLDAVGLDLPELQARPRADAGRGVARRVATLRRRYPTPASPQGEPEEVAAEKARLAAERIGCGCCAATRASRRDALTRRF